MARIRSIKPEFWTSEQVVCCSPNARLLFIGLWTFADDGGVHPAAPMRLKMQVFPGDSFSCDDMKSMVEELVSADLVEEYEVDGKPYWRVSGWKHQRIDQPTYKYPQPDGYVPNNPKRRRMVDDGSANSSGEDDDGSPREGSGVDGEGSGGNNSPPDGGDVPDGTPDCPHQDIIALYHELLPSNPKVKVWNEERRGWLRARWREDPKRQDLEYWRKFFSFIASRCPFLTGQVEGRESVFLPGLDWMVRPRNFAKIIEGQYRDKDDAA